MIDDAVIQYIADKRTKPKFILMDMKTYGRFTESLLPRENIELALPEEAKGSESVKFYSTMNCVVEILEVKSDKPLFEIVG